jgi:hypothetical protein
MWSIKDLKYNGDNSDGIIGITFLFAHDDGRTAVIDNRISDPSSIKQTITNSLAEFERKDKLAGFLKNPPTLDEIMAVPTPVIDPNQAYNEKKSQLVQAKNDLELGLIKSIQYDNLLEEVIKLKP